MSTMDDRPRFGLALEYVPDVEAASRFFVEVLGQEVRRKHPTYAEFDGFAIASDERVGGGEGPELYWLVDDAAAAFGRMSATAEVWTPLTEMPFGKVFALRDPAGRPHYVLEFARERPSRPAGG
jgi:predicted enzyme related to lactoylglutathione lyase